jgi:hypothetical protein
VIANRGFSRLSAFCSVWAANKSMLICLGILSGALMAAAQHNSIPPTLHFGVSEDWSHHHLVFSNPGSFQDAETNGDVERWSEIVSSARYQQQQMRMLSRGRVLVAEPLAKYGTALPVRTSAWPHRLNAVWLSFIPLGVAMMGAGFRRRAAWWLLLLGGLLAIAGFVGCGAGVMKSTTDGSDPSSLTRDWSMNLGSGATVGAGSYPAKYSFNINSASCSSDYVAFNTGLAGSASQPTVVAYNNAYSGCGGTLPQIFWQFNTAYPQGSSTGDGSKIITSAALSFDGTQLAFVQSNSSNVASLVLLKWASNSSLVQMDTGSNNVTPANYRSCAAPCMTRLTLNGSPNDTNSAPYVDYSTDTIYIGDDSGKLHKFTNVFLGTPAESGAPFAAVSSAKLTSPIFDSSSGKVFLGDAGGFLYSVTSSSGTVVKSAQLDSSAPIVDPPIVDSTAGKLYVFVTESAAGSLGGGNHNAVAQYSTGFGSGANPAAYAVGNGSGSSGAPLHAGALDDAYITSSNATGNLYVCFPANGLVQISVSAGTMSGTISSQLTVAGTNAACSPASEILSVDAASTINEAGGINASATSVTITSAAGFNNNQYIEIDSEKMLVTAISSNMLTITRAQLGTTAASHANGATVKNIHDRVFLSVPASGSQTGCTGACVYSFDVTNLALPSSASDGLAVAGGTGGIIVDNVVTSTTGASQVYFSTLSNETCNGNGTTGSGSGGCAVQASQKALN